MTVLELLEMASEDTEIIVSTEKDEVLYDGTADDFVRFYLYLGETEISSSYSIHRDRIYIPVNPDDEEMNKIKEEIAENG